MSNKFDNLARVGFRVPQYLYDYYKRISQVKGVPISTLMMLALENQIKQDLLIENSNNLPQLLEEIKKLDKGNL